MNTNLNTNTSVISEEALGNDTVTSFNEATNTVEKEMNKEVKLPKTRLFLTELNAMLKSALADDADVRNYVIEPKLTNQVFYQQGAVRRITRRRQVLESWASVSTALQRVIDTLDAGEMVDAQYLQSISHDISNLTAVTTYNALESLTTLGYVPVELKLLSDELESPVLEEITPEPVKVTNPVSDRFNKVTDIHRAVEVNFEQHERYFGGYEDDDLVDLVSKGYLLGRDLNDFLGVVIDKEDTLPNGITLLELIIINNNLAFIADLAAKDSPIRSFELYVWNVSKLLPEAVAGEVDVLQRTLNSLKGLAERLHSRTGIADNLNSLFGFGLDAGLDARGSRSSSSCGDSRNRVGLGRSSLSRSRHLVSRDEELDREEDLRDREEDLRDREEEMDRYYRDHGRRGRYSR